MRSLKPDPGESQRLLPRRHCTWPVARLGGLGRFFRHPVRPCSGVLRPCPPGQRGRGPGVQATVFFWGGCPRPTLCQEVRPPRTHPCAGPLGLGAGEPLPLLKMPELGLPRLGPGPGGRPQRQVSRQQQEAPGTLGTPMAAASTRGLRHVGCPQLRQEARPPGPAWPCSPTGAGGGPRRPAAPGPQRGSAPCAPLRAA